MCLGVPEPASSPAKQAEVKEAMEKAILKILGLKAPPKPKKGLKEKIPQFILDLYNKQVNESMGTGEAEMSDSNNQEFENEGL